MHKQTLFLRRVGGLAAVLLIISVLPLANALHAAQPVQAQEAVMVPTVIDVTDPASGLITVEIVFPADLLPASDHLNLLFYMLEDHPEALKSFVALASESGQEVPVRTGSEIVQQLDLTGLKGALTVRYTLDPLYFPPGYSHDEPLNAAGRLTADLGVLRTSDIFPDGEFSTTDFVYQAEFRLPEDWQAITPWPALPDGTVPIPASSLKQTEYLAAGPFVTETATFDSTQVIVAALANEEALPAATVIEMLTHMATLFDSAPQADYLAVSIVPETFIYGGSAGTLTINANPDPHFVAHEMIHWWNTLELTEGDATAWFREGFTEYYSLRIMGDLGIWPDEYMTQGWSMYQDGLAQLESDPPLSLAEISEKQQQGEDYLMLVYLKGALFGRLLDSTLQEKNRSLDEAMRLIVSGEQVGLSNADLQGIFHDVYDGLVDDLFEQYVITGAVLPQPPA